MASSCLLPAPMCCHLNVDTSHIDVVLLGVMGFNVAPMLCTRHRHCCKPQAGCELHILISLSQLTSPEHQAVKQQAVTLLSSPVHARTLLRATECICVLAGQELHSALTR